LKIIHTDICRPFDATSFSKEKYFITFIDDYLCHGYVYLLHEKSQAIDALKVFINEVERQKNMKVRFIKSDRGGEYYKDLMILDNLQVHLLNSLRNMTYMLNTQC
jgi:hypothetical protein